MLNKLLGIVLSSFDSVNITTWHFNVLRFSINSSNLPSVKIKLMFQRTAIKLLFSKGNHWVNLNLQTVAARPTRTDKNLCWDRRGQSLRSIKNYAIILLSSNKVSIPTVLMAWSISIPLIDMKLPQGNIIMIVFLFLSSWKIIESSRIAKLKWRYGAVNFRNILCE